MGYEEGTCLSARWQGASSHSFMDVILANATPRLRSSLSQRWQLRCIALQCSPSNNIRVLTYAHEHRIEAVTSL